MLTHNTHANTYTHTYTHACTQAHIHSHTHMRTHTYTHACTHAHAHTHTHTQLYPPPTAVVSHSPWSKSCSTPLSRNVLCTGVWTHTRQHRQDHHSSVCRTSPPSTVTSPHCTPTPQLVLAGQPLSVHHVRKNTLTHTQADAYTPSYTVHVYE